MSRITLNGIDGFRRACEGGGSCVEVADIVALRDSKDPEGPVLLFTRDEWEDFVNGVKAGVFDKV